jgi:hypothetical protein
MVQNLAQLVVITAERNHVELKWKSLFWWMLIALLFHYIDVIFQCHCFWAFQISLGSWMCCDKALTRDLQLFIFCTMVEVGYRFIFCKLRQQFFYKALELRI